MARPKAPPTSKPAASPGEQLDVDIAAELDKLPPEQAEMLVRALELAMKRRRAMLLGYLAVLVVLIVGELAALLIWAEHHAPGRFLAWMFLVPMALAGGILVWTPKLARRIGVPPTPPST